MRRSEENEGKIDIAKVRKARKIKKMPRKLWSSLAKLAEAQEIIWMTEKILCDLVKKYLEEHTIFEKKVNDDYDWNRILKREIEFLEITLEDGLQVKLQCWHHFFYDKWFYKITCDVLEIYDLIPYVKHYQLAQAELTIKYIGLDDDFRERKLKLFQYGDPGPSPILSVKVDEIPYLRAMEWARKNLCMEEMRKESIYINAKYAKSNILDINPPPEEMIEKIKEMWDDE